MGDIHGRADLLADLLGRLEACAEADRRDGGEPIVVFLGDYVDRGPNSREAIDLLLAGRPHGYERRYLKGNHEQMMLDFIADPLANRAWTLQGGAETLISYGVHPPSPVNAGPDDWAAAAAALKTNIPSEHHAFLDALERYVVLGDYAFVHAGVDASRPIDQQSDDDLYWAREAFLASKRRFSHRVVHGHTPVDRPFTDERRVAVDTGAYASGVLTAARFEGPDVSFIQASDRPAAAAR